MISSRKLEDLHHEVRLRALLGEQRSFSQIARELGRTRNSIAGKVDRLRRREEEHAADVR